MKKSVLAVVLVSCAMAASMAVAEAASKQKVPKGALLIEGCAQYIPPFCTGVQSGGVNYTFVAATPPIPWGTKVSIVGKKAGDVGVCFGTPIEVVSWKSMGSCLTK